MADEYVKLDDVLKLLNRNSITKAITFSDGISIYDSVQNLPTADVVPKSEVERLENILNSYALQYGTVVDRKKVVDQAKVEVAREIFEEIEAIKCVGLLPSSWVKQFTELKKKYTEAEAEPPKGE